MGEQLFLSLEGVACVHVALILCCRVAVQLVLRSFSEETVPHAVADVSCLREEASSESSCATTWNYFSVTIILKLCIMELELTSPTCLPHVSEIPLMVV